MLQGNDVLNSVCFETDYKQDMTRRATKASKSRISNLAKSKNNQITPSQDLPNQNQDERDQEQQDQEQQCDPDHQEVKDHQEQQDQGGQGNQDLEEDEHHHEDQHEDVHESEDQRTAKLTSASKRKLGHVLDEDDIQYTPLKNAEECSGYRFMEISNFVDIIKSVHNFCRGNIKVTEMNNKRMGVDSVLQISCDECHLDYVTQSSKQKNPGSWRPQDSTDLNTRMVYALTEMGCSKKQMHTFCSIMDIPATKSSRTMWENRINTIHDAHRHVTQEIFRKNREELFQIYTADEDGNIYIPVTYDVTWMTRGYSSTVGVGFVMSLDTGKPLDAATKVNYCQQCTFCPHKKHSRKYEQWYRLHKPNCTYDNVTSKGMEPCIAEELWERSSSYNIYYRFMVCDGDSSSWKRVRFIYGACATCRRYYEEMTPEEQSDFDKSERGQEFWASHRDTNNCLSVQKENCINHVTKGLGTALRNRRMEFKLGGTGKNTKHKLTDDVISKRTSLYRRVLVKNKLGPKATAQQYKVAIEESRREILAGHFHSCVSESEVRHIYCRSSDEWCKKKMDKEFVEQHHYLEERCRRILISDYKRLTSDVILRRCLRAKTQNQQESINSTLWARIPKRKFHGRERVELAAASAILNWCIGSKSQRLILANLQLEFGKTTKKIGQDVDKKRVRKSLNPPTKKKLRKELEKNVDYEPGAFLA